METTTKIANLLLSEEQANKDLAFSLIESLGVDFGEVRTVLKDAIIDKCAKLTGSQNLSINICSLKLKVYTYFESRVYELYNHNILKDVKDGQGEQYIIKRFLSLLKFYHYYRRR